ncbi:MAG: efflux RND transporter periplasmic adaptor subunit [Rhodocyclaceae bacterium]|nr:efflux RND transporter periplasmic adaptor subunit [Rhodocyclaceae bacterium]MBX3669712.1 efflux RND transporter periplasmic adaptor subunit [Rhodocyclaceae bacterium]
MSFVLAGLAAQAPQAADVLAVSAAQVQALGIEVAVAESGKALVLDGLPARVAVPLDQERVLAAPLAGVVQSLAVAAGGRVRRGQIVATLASPQALELQSGALQAASQSSLAQENLRRDEQLFAEGLIPAARLSASRTAAAQAAAMASERAQGLALAGARPGQVGGALALAAPIDGVVLEQGVQLGQRVDAATLLYRIARMDTLWLEIQAPLAHAAAYRLGAEVRVAGGSARGKLIALGATVDAGSQSVLLRALVETGAAALRPGQAIQVELDTAAAGARLPAAAVIRHAGRTWAMVQREAAAGAPAGFAPQEVQVQAQSGDSVMVEGLAAGTPVAVRGLAALKAMWSGVGKP